MQRKDIYLLKEQIDFLVKLPGTLSEHIRRAINDYIDKLSKSASSSQSRKEDE